MKTGIIMQEPPLKLLLRLAGTFSILAIMVGTVTEHIVLAGNRTERLSWENDAARVEVASQLTFLSGLIQVNMGVCVCV